MFHDLKDRDILDSNPSDDMHMRTYTAVVQASHVLMPYHLQLAIGGQLCTD